MGRISHFDQPKVEDSFQIAATTDHNHNPNQNQNQNENQNDGGDQQQQASPFKFPRTYSLTHLWESDYMGSISQLLNDNSSYNVGFNGEDNNGGGFSRADEKLPFGQSQQSTDSTKSHVHQTTFVNPVYEFQSLRNL